MSKIWRYSLVDDNGMAPCAHGGVLTLTCCKPKIRKIAEVGDWVIGFVSRRVAKGSPTVSWVGRVSQILPLGDYEIQFRGRPDAIYRRNGFELDGEESLEKIRDDDYHCGIESRDWEGRNALVFEPFWYWGNNSKIIPPSQIGDLIHPFVGETSKGSTPERVKELELWLAGLMAPGVHGKPRDVRRDQCGACS